MDLLWPGGEMLGFQPESACPVTTAASARGNIMIAFMLIRTRGYGLKWLIQNIYHRLDLSVRQQSTFKSIYENIEESNRSLKSSFLRGDVARGGGWILSGCCNRRGFFRPRAASRQR